MSYPLPPQSATAPSSYASAPASPGGMTAALNPAPTNGLRQPVASQPLSASAPRNCRLQHLPAHRVRLKWQRTRRNSIRNNRRRLMAFTRTPNPMRWHPVATRGPIFKPPSGNRPIRIRPRAIPARRPIPRRPEVAVNQRTGRCHDYSWRRTGNAVGARRRSASIDKRADVDRNDRSRRGNDGPNAHERTRPDQWHHTSHATRQLRLRWWRSRQLRRVTAGAIQLPQLRRLAAGLLQQS